MKRQARLGLAAAVLFALLLAAVLMFAGGFEGAVVNVAEDLSGYGGPHSDQSSGSRTLFHSDARIGGQKNGESYGAYDARRSRTADSDFFGFPCNDGCIRHREGYRWAVAHDIRNARQCNGSDWGFIEGCAAFAAGEHP